MPAPRIPRTVHRPRRQPRPGDSAQHIENVRALPCCITGEKSRVEAHHLLRVGEQLPKGMSRRNEDRWAIPLRIDKHRALHHSGDEEGFLAQEGIDGRALARALWAARDDIDAMERIVFRAQQQARLKSGEAL